MKEKPCKITVLHRDDPYPITEAMTTREGKIIVIEVEREMTKDQFECTMEHDGSVYNVEIRTNGRLRAMTWLNFDPCVKAHLNNGFLTIRLLRR